MSFPNFMRWAKLGNSGLTAGWSFGAPGSEKIVILPRAKYECDGKEKITKVSGTSITLTLLVESANN